MYGYTDSGIPSGYPFSGGGGQFPAPSGLPPYPGPPIPDGSGPPPGSQGGGLMNSRFIGPPPSPPGHPREWIGPPGWQESPYDRLQRVLKLLSGGIGPYQGGGGGFGGLGPMQGGGQNRPTILPGPHFTPPAQRPPPPSPRPPFSY